MNPALQLAATLLERLIRTVGWCLLPFALYVVLAEFAVTALRYALGYSRNWLNESVLAANAVVFLLGASWALLEDQHVRVDVFSRHYGWRAKAIAELIGIAVFLVPVCVLIFGVSLDYVAQSYHVNEHSREADGLSYLWLQKALIPAGAALLLLAGIARALRQVLTLLEQAPAPPTALERNAP